MTAFDDIEIGDEVAPLKRGPFTPVHLMRWSSSIENWHRIHYDEPFARSHEGLDGLLINGSWKQHFLVALMTNWVGSDGWLVEISFQFRRMDQVGATLTAWGTVTDKSIVEGMGLVKCDIGIRDEEARQSTPGRAVVALKLEGGPDIPYPFPESADFISLD